MKRKKEQANFSYKCNKCGKTVKRIEMRRWIKSFCEEKGTTSRLYFIPF